MAKKPDLMALLSKQLGPDVARNLLNRVQKMKNKNVKPDKIEETFMTDLNREIEKRVSGLVGVSVNALSGVKILVSVGPPEVTVAAKRK